METSAPMVNDILSNAFFQSCSHIIQTLHQSFHDLNFLLWTGCWSIPQSIGLRSGLFGGRKSGSL